MYGVGIYNLQSEEKEQKGEMQETEERLAESLTSRAQLSSREAEHIMDIHYAEMDEYESKYNNPTS